MNVADGGPCQGRHLRPFQYADCVTRGCTDPVHPARGPSPRLAEREERGRDPERAQLSQIASDAMGRVLDRAANQPGPDFAGVAGSLRRDYPGWDAYNARLDAVPDPDSPDGRAERHRISYEYSSSPEWIAAQRRLHGQPEADAEDEDDPWPPPNLRCGFGAEDIGVVLRMGDGSEYLLPADRGCDFVAKSERKLAKHRRRMHQRDGVPRPVVVAVPELPPTIWDRLGRYVFETGPGWLPFVVIIGGVIIWAVILDTLFGLENLRRLLGWTMS